MTLNTTESELRKLFFQFGNVDYVMVNRNSLNGRSLRSGEVVSELPTDLY
jgi:RNA recognition motif-containing protein